MNNANTMWGHREKTDYLETAADCGLFNISPSIWPEDDPHPLDKMALNADKIASSYGKNRIGTGNIAPDTVKINPHLDFGFTPANNASPKEMESDINTNTLWEKASQSIGAGDHADDNLTTSQYNYFNSRDSATIKRDETLSEARQRSQEITWPTIDMNNRQKALSATATKNQQKGFEMEQPMGDFVKANGSFIFPASQETESRYTYDVGKAWGDMTGENREAMTASAHNADTSFQKNFEDDPDRYRAFINRIGQFGPTAFHDAREIKGGNIRQNAENLAKGLAYTAKRAKNTADKSFLLTGKGAEEAGGHNIVNAPYQAQEIYDDKKHIQALEDKLVKLEDIYVPGRPDKTLENMQSFCYQSVLGRHSFDLVVLYYTRGFGIAGNAIFRSLDATADLYVQDLVENGNDDLAGSLERGFQVGGTVSLNEHMLTTLTNPLGPHSRLAWQFLIKSLSDKEQEKLLNKVIAEQQQKQQER